MAPDQKGAQQQGARLVFVDESSFSRSPSVRATWAPKGKTPIIRHYRGKEKLCAVAAIDCDAYGNEADVLFYMQPTSIISQTIIDFLDALHREVPGKIVLLWDSYACHKSSVVNEHIADCADWLSVERFPTYAPELNPPEYMFSALKGKDLANVLAVSIEQVADMIETGIDRLAGDQSIIRGFLRASGLFD